MIHRAIGCRNGGEYHALLRCGINPGRNYTRAGRQIASHSEKAVGSFELNLTDLCYGLKFTNQIDRLKGRDKCNIGKRLKIAIFPDVISAIRDPAFKDDIRIFCSIFARIGKDNRTSFPYKASFFRTVIIPESNRKESGTQNIVSAY